MNVKRKGNAAECEAARLWRDSGWTKARRRLTREEARHGDGVDLEGTGPYLVQVKHNARPNPLEALGEIDEGLRIGVPVAMVKKSGSRQGWVVCLRWDDFSRMMTLVERAYDKQVNDGPTAASG